MRGSLRPLQESFQIGLETGLIEFACVNTNIYCIHSFLCGRPLERVEEETRAYSALYRQFKQETNYNYNEVFRQSMLNFMGRSDDPVRLVGEAYDEERMIAQNRERGDKTGAFFIHFQKLLLCYHFRHFAEAREHARSARKLLDAVLAKFEIPNLRFYEALTALALAEQAPRAARWRLLLRARLDMMRLRYWAHFSPANYRHKYDLCAAEYARVIGNENAARLAYDRAITGASQNEFIHEEALAFELAGRFYAATDRPVLAEFHLKAAYNAYREWGAAAKHRDLVDHFPKYLTQKGQSLSDARRRRRRTRSEHLHAERGRARHHHRLEGLHHHFARGRALQAAFRADEDCARERRCAARLHSARWGGRARHPGPWRRCRCNDRSTAGPSLPRRARIYPSRWRSSSTGHGSRLSSPTPPRTNAAAPSPTS